MNRNTRNTGNGVNRLISRLTADKKKAVMAFCLIAVMVFMWARLLGKKTPQNASAAMTTQVMKMESQASPELKISFIELPKVRGRNDVLTRDFFTVGSWYDFVSDGRDSTGVGDVDIVSRDKLDAVTRRVAENLRLEVIELGENPQAFINDKLLGVGDKLLVADSVRTYECQIVGIEENTVFVRCGEAEIELKLTQMTKTAN